MLVFFFHPVSDVLQLHTSKASEVERLITALRPENTNQHKDAIIQMRNLIRSIGRKQLDISKHFADIVTALSNLLREKTAIDTVNDVCLLLTILLAKFPLSKCEMIKAIPRLLSVTDRTDMSLPILEKLSESDHKAVLLGNAISHCLKQRFSTKGQKAALKIVSNCCLDLDILIFPIEQLTPFLHHEDTECVEYATLALLRLVNKFQKEPLILEHIFNEKFAREFHKMWFARDMSVATIHNIDLILQKLAPCQNLDGLWAIIDSDGLIRQSFNTSDTDDDASPGSSTKDVTPLPTDPDSVRSFLETVRSHLNQIRGETVKKFINRMTLFIMGCVLGVCGGISVYYNIYNIGAFLIVLAIVCILFCWLIKDDIPNPVNQ